MLLSLVLALVLQDWDAGELDGDVRVSHVFELASPAKQVVAGCPCFTTRLLDDRHLEVTIATKGIIGRNHKPVHVAHDGDASTHLAIRFDVTTTNRAERPEISLLYASMDDPSPVLRVVELAQKRTCSYEVRCADRVGRAIDRFELRSGTTTWSGQAALDALARLRREAGLVESTDPPPALPPPAAGIPVYFFYSKSCGECLRYLARELPPAFAKRPSLKLVPLEISSSDENLRRLVGVLLKFDKRENTLPGLLVGDRYLGGFEAIRKELDGALDNAVPPTEIAADPAAYYERITVPAVLVAGLLDGLNPCAFATAVLLASFLAARRRPAVEILLAGGLFTLAVFGTYLAIGLGLKAIAQQITGPTISIITASIALVLAVVSVRDAVVYARTGEAGRVALQLPGVVKQHVHAAMGRMRVGLAIGAISAGVLVTLLEAVCTGQLLVPVIVAMTRRTTGAFALLLLYNLAFIVPLIVVLSLSVAGVRSPRLVEWSKRNVVVGKVGLAVAFLAMAAYLIAPFLR